MTLRILILIALLLALDFYVFQAFRFGFRNSSDIVQRITGWFFWALSFFSVAVLIVALFKDWSLWPKAVKTYAGAFIFILVMSKLVLLIFLLTDDIFRGIRWAYIKLFSNPSSSDTTGSTATVFISRSDFLVRSGLIVASLPFVGMLWGMVRGAYDYQVKKVKLPLSKLPDAFR